MRFLRCPTTRSSASSRTGGSGVGGHILLVGAEELGWTWPYGLVQHVEEIVHDATGAPGGVLGWLTNTALSAVVGVVVGAVVVAVLHVVPRRGAGNAAH